MLSINIARGRDHGIPSYTAVRDALREHDEYKFLYPNNGAGTPTMRSGENFFEFFDFFEFFNFFEFLKFF